MFFRADQVCRGKNILLFTAMVPDIFKSYISLLYSYKLTKLRGLVSLPFGSSLVSRNRFSEHFFITHQPAQPNLYQNILFNFKKQAIEEK